MDEDVVAQVDVGLEGGQGRVTGAGQGLGRQHRLEGGAGAVGQGGEAQPAGVAQEDDAPGHADDVVGLLAGLQVPVALADGGDRGGDGESDRVGLPALGAQALALGGADDELLARARLLAGLPGLPSLLGLSGAFGLLGSPGSAGLLGAGRPPGGRGVGSGGVGRGEVVLLDRISHARESSGAPAGGVLPPQFGRP